MLEYMTGTKSCSALPVHAALKKYNSCPCWTHFEAVHPVLFLATGSFPRNRFFSSHHPRLFAGLCPWHLQIHPPAIICTLPFFLLSSCGFVNFFAAIEKTRICKTTRHQHLPRRDGPFSSPPPPFFSVTPPLGKKETNIPLGSKKWGRW